MIANLFNKAHPLNIFLLLAFMILFFFIALFKSGYNSVSYAFWLLKSADLALVILLITLYYFMVETNRLTYTNHYSILYFCLLFALFYPALILTKLLVIQVVLALAFKRIYSLRINQNIKEKLFDSALLIGVSSVFFQESGLFILLIYSAIFLFKRTYWNFLFIPLFGFITPYFLIYIYSLSIADFSFFYRVFYYKMNFNLELFQQIPLSIYIGIVFLIGLINFMICTAKTSNYNNEFRGLWRLIFVHFITAGLLLFFGMRFTIYNAVYLIFPTGIILANYLQTITVKWRKEAFVFIFIALVLSGYLYNFKP